MVASIGKIASPSQGVTYYERDIYYAKDDPAHRAASTWAGKGADALGLSGPVDPDTFKAVLEGEVPDGPQPATILERRRAECDSLSENIRPWVFPSLTSASGHVEDPHHLYARITEAGGAKFRFHGLRNCFITVAERDLMLPATLMKRLVNHARPNDVIEGYAADRTLAQLRALAQRVADRIDALMNGEIPA